MYTSTPKRSCLKRDVYANVEKVTGVVMDIVGLSGYDHGFGHAFGLDMVIATVRLRVCMEFYGTSPN